MHNSAPVQLPGRERSSPSSGYSTPHPRHLISHPPLLPYISLFLPGLIVCVLISPSVSQRILHLAINLHTCLTHLNQTNLSHCFSSHICRRSAFKHIKASCVWEERSVLNAFTPHLYLWFIRSPFPPLSPLSHH